MLYDKAEIGMASLGLEDHKDVSILANFSVENQFKNVLVGDGSTNN